MKKQNIRIPRLTDKSISRKYFLFIFVCLAFFVSGFFVSKVFAEENISFTEVPADDITGEATWTLIGSPYVVNQDVTVAEGATLTIEPGVIVKLSNGASIFVDGKIDAEGTVTLPIYFTSNNDDFEGSTDDDTESCNPVLDEEGNPTEEEPICENVDQEPSKGDWGMLFLDSLTEVSIFNNVVSRYSDQDGLFLYNGASVNSDNFNTDSEIITFGSSSTFTNLTAASVEIHSGSDISIGNSTIINPNGFAIFVNDNSSLNLTNSKLEGSGSYLIYVFNNSNAIFNTVEIIGDAPNNTVVAGVFRGSTLEVSNSNITSTEGDGFEVFEDSYLTLLDTSISCKGNGISIFQNANLNLSGGSVSCLNDGLALYEEAKAEISGVKISDAMDAGIIAYNNTDPNPITITKSEITGNNYGFFVYGTNFSAHQNSIHDNLSDGALTYPSNDPEGETQPVYNLDFTSNYWGDPTGPLYIDNLDGLGDSISDGISYSPFLTADPLIPVAPTKNPVIIIPGIMGSQLIRDYGDKSEIWPDVPKTILSFFDNFLRDLELLPNGDENLDFPMKTGDIIRKTPITNIFNNLISNLENNGGYIEGENLFVFPYDWRLSSIQNAELLKNKIEEIVANSDSGKVDIIAHSMGGLLVKQYIQANGKEKIDHLVFLGTPHLGAPKAFKALMYGDDMGTTIGFYSLLNPNIVKDISQNMPSIFELLPSSKYVANLRYVSEKVSGGSPIYFDYESTQNFLKEEGKNADLIQSADIFHQGIDDIDLSGINVSNISACGEATPSAINISKKLIGKDYKLDYANGDGTVPLDSSTGITNVAKYYVDKVDHSAIPSVGNVPDAILNILGDKPIPTDSILFDDINECTPVRGVILSVHSPITLDLYDEEGNHSGFNADGNLENNILGVSYDTIGEAKFAFVPDGVIVNVKGNATGSGSFDLAIEKVIDGKTIETKFWNDVAITSTSQMNFDFNSYDNINTIELDSNGFKTNIPSSNILSEGEDYLAVPNKIIETTNHNRGGSSIINNSKNIIIKPDTDTDVEANVLQNKVNNIIINKQKSTKKLLSILNQKEIFSKQETVKSIPLISPDARHKLGIWDTIKLLTRWFLNIFK